MVKANIMAHRYWAGIEIHAKISHRDRRRGLDTGRGKITERCRGRMRGANALCDLVVFGLAPPNLTSKAKWDGKSRTMTDAVTDAGDGLGTAGYEWRMTTYRSWVRAELLDWTKPSRVDKGWVEKLDRKVA